MSVIAQTWNYLNCNENRLDSLDVHENTALVQLSCDGNDLTSLTLGAQTGSESHNVRGQPAKAWMSECPALVNLYCSDNQLASLDISANTVLVGGLRPNQLTNRMSAPTRFCIV